MKNQLLWPVALLQGLWLSRRVPTLPSPAGRTGHVGFGLSSPVRLVGLGDSVMAGTGVRDQRHSLTAQFARLLHNRLHRDVAWRMHGSNGATSAGVLARVAPRVPRADIYLVSVGVNDVTRRVEPARFESNLEGIFGLLRQKAPHATIVFGGMPPFDYFPALPWPLKSMLAIRARDMQRLAMELATRMERVLCFQFPDSMPADQFASDGFHPAAIGCESWARGLLDLWAPVAASVAPVAPVALVAARAAEALQSARTISGLGSAQLSPT